MVRSLFFSLNARSSFAKSFMALLTLAKPLIVAVLVLLSLGFSTNCLAAEPKLDTDNWQAYCVNRNSTTGEVYKRYYYGKKLNYNRENHTITTPIITIDVKKNTATIVVVSYDYYNRTILVKGKAELDSLGKLLNDDRNYSDGPKTVIAGTPDYYLVQAIEKYKIAEDNSWSGKIKNFWNEVSLGDVFEVAGNLYELYVEIAPLFGK